MSEFMFQPRDFARDIRVERADLTEGEQLARWDTELPPSEVWLVNPARGQFETPSDSRGIIDVRALVALGKSTVQEGYTWSVRKTRDDHLCWPETAYQRLAWQLDNPLPMQFRNIPPNKVRFPLEFERWKHAITIPPDFPSLEVMKYYVDAWGTAQDLYRTVARAVRWERRFRDRAEALASGNVRLFPSTPDDVIAEEFMAETLAEHFRGAEMHLQRHLALPKEFRILRPEDNAKRILHLIGYQVRHRCRDGLHARYSTFLPPRCAGVAM